MKRRTIAVLLFTLGLSIQSRAEILGKSGRFGGITIRYKVVLPNAYDATRAYPAILAFAGGAQTLDGVNGMLERNWSEAEKRGYIVVSPAAPSNNLFFERGGDRIFPDFLDQMLREYKIEGGKFHVAGPSNGGLSAFHIASMYPQYFRSVTGFPGYLREESEAKINALKPLCIFMHVGERDLEWQMPMQRQSDFLLEKGFRLHFTIEPDQGHGIQTLTGDGSHRLFEQLESCK
jgi:poly(3-hydroxybutyrate) depolymerase